MKVYNQHTKTLPCVIHAPDHDTNLWWKKIVSLCDRAPTRQANLCADLTIVTWNNLEKGQFEKSLEKNGVPYVLKGADAKPWLNYYKFRYNIEVASECGTKYIMGCDSHDVAVINDPSVIVERFKTFEERGCKLLFNCERVFYPPFPETQHWQQYQADLGGRHHHKFLNAGAWIGQTKFCKEFFSEADKIQVYNLFDCEKYEYLKESSIGCDQSSLHHIFPRFSSVTKLDYECKIFMNIANIDPNDIQLVTTLI